MEKTIDTNGAPELVIECKGDLQIEGQSDATVEIETDDERANVTQNGNRIVITSEHDLQISAPRGATVNVAAVGGDMQIEGFDTHVNIGHIGGDLNVDDVFEIVIQSVGGDCRMEDVSGTVRIGAVGGDLRAEEVTFIGSSISVGGDVHIDLETGHEPVAVSAGGDVHVGLKEDANCTVSITDSQGVRRIKFGDGDTAIRIAAGGDVNVNSDGEEGEGMRTNIESALRDAMNDVQREMNDMQRNMEQMAQEFSTRFAGMDVPEWRVERAKSKAEAAARKVEAKLAHRMRHLEAHAHKQAERAAHRAARTAERAARRASKGFNFTFGPGQGPFGPGQGPFGPRPPAPPQAPQSPQAPRAPQAPQAPATPSAATKPFETPRPKGASDDERMLILRMLSEKKITTEQADQLLAALDS